jgi:hypothetical protein
MTPDGNVCRHCGWVECKGNCEVSLECGAHTEHRWVPSAERRDDGLVIESCTVMVCIRCGVKRVTP